MMFLIALKSSIIKMNRFLLLAFALILPLSQAQALIIGAMPGNPPLSSLADKNNHFIGFEIDIMQGICERLKTPCTFVPVVMKQIQKTLIDAQVDLVIAAYIIPDEPPPGFIFSLPYLPSSGKIIVNTNSRITEPDNLIHKLVGVRHGTLFDDLLIELYGNQVNMAKYFTMDQLMTALVNRDVDAAVIDWVAADYWMINGGGQYRTVGDKLPIGNGYGILATMRQGDLIDQVNMALQSMIADGSYTKIYAQYFTG